MFSPTMLERSQIARSRECLQRAHIDWAAIGSPVRAYLRRWIGPAFAGTDHFISPDNPQIGLTNASGHWGVPA